MTGEVIPREKVERLLERTRERAQDWKEQRHRWYPEHKLAIPEVYKVAEYTLELVLSDCDPEEMNVYWCPWCGVVHRKGVCPVCSSGDVDDWDNEHEAVHASENA